MLSIFRCPSVIFLKEKPGQNMDNCIYSDNKRCQDNDGNLNLIIHACGFQHHVTKTQISYFCNFAAECGEAMSNWSCSVATHTIKCFECINRTLLQKPEFGLETKPNSEKKTYPTVSTAGISFPFPKSPISYLLLFLIIIPITIILIFLILNRGRIVYFEKKFSVALTISVLYLLAVFVLVGSLEKSDST